ncbi:unnamed protein product, partial [Amoebophrya sp. A120]
VHQKPPCRGVALCRAMHQRAFQHYLQQHGDLLPAKTTAAAQHLHPSAGATPASSSGTPYLPKTGAAGAGAHSATTSMRGGNNMLAPEHQMPGGYNMDPRFGPNGQQQQHTQGSALMYNNSYNQQQQTNNPNLLPYGKMYDGTTVGTPGGGPPPPPWGQTPQSGVPPPPPGSAPHPFPPGHPGAPVLGMIQVQQLPPHPLGHHPQQPFGGQIKASSSSSSAQHQLTVISGRLGHSTH